jgi:hypothetical protein
MLLKNPRGLQLESGTDTPILGSGFRFSRLAAFVSFVLTGRRPALAAALILGAVLSIAYFNVGSWQKTWDVVHVHAMQKSFADLRTVTHAIDCVRQGRDPYRTGICDPMHRRYNYPQPWLWLKYLGVSPASTNAIGIGLGVAVFSAMIALFDVRTPISGVIAFLITISPPVLLGVERGNIDLVIFSLLTCSILFSSTMAARRRDIFLASVITLTSVLKLYPIVALSAVARSFRGVVLAAISAVIATILIGVTTGSHLLEIGRNTPMSFWFSYGSLALPLAWMHGFRFSLDSTPPVGLRVTMLGVAFLFLVSAIWLSRRNRTILSEYLPPLDEQPLSALAASGGAIFVGSFLMGISFDYRLIFLICTLPLFLRAYDQDRNTKRLLLPCATLAFMWLSASPLSEGAWFAKEFLDWTLFGVLGPWIGLAIWPLSNSPLTPGSATTPPRHC